MAIVRDRAKYLPDTDSGNAAVDLSARQFTFVKCTAGVTPGAPTFTTPTAQGELCYGIQHNVPAAAVGERVEVEYHGIGEVIADSAFNAGVPITVAGANGRAEAAASGDYVMAISREASLGSGHKVSVRIIDPYVVP